MYIDPPQRLIDLSLFASLMRQGAKALGDSQAIDLFDDVFICDLLEKNWPIGDKDDPTFGTLHEFVLEKLSSFHAHDPRSTVNSSIAAWLQESASAETREFLSNPENLLALEDALKSTLQKITKAYGNPLNAATLSQSYLKQSFDAVKNSTVEAKTGQLNAVLAFVSAGLQKYSKNDLLVSEFWHRMHGQLMTKDWPFSHDPDKTLMHTLKLLTRSRSYEKLMSALKQLTKNDPSSMPADKSEEVAWAANFILGNSKDLKESAASIFQEFVREAKSPGGISMIRSALLSERISLN